MNAAGAAKKARWRARQLWWLSFGREVRHVKEGREHTLPVGEWKVVKRKTVIRVGYNAGTSCGASTTLTVRRIGEGFDVRRLRSKGKARNRDLWEPETKEEGT